MTKEKSKQFLKIPEIKTRAIFCQQSEKRELQDEKIKRNSCVCVYIYIYIYIYMYIYIYIYKRVGVSSAHGIVANVLDCYIIVSEFELQLCYYIPFWTNTLGKGINLLTLPAPNTQLRIKQYPGPSGIRAGWALETKSRLGAE